MESHTVRTLIESLDRAGARYLIVGGLAVVAHGFVRFTADLDLVLDPEPEGLRRALDALASLDYRPRAPVALAEFADALRRREWVETKGLTVFSLFSPRHPATEVDLFVETPFDFEKVYARAARFEVSPGVAATFVPLDELLVMKRAAARDQDLRDVTQLEALRDTEGGPSV